MFASVHLEQLSSHANVEGMHSEQKVVSRTYRMHGGKRSEQNVIKAGLLSVLVVAYDFQGCL